MALDIRKIADRIRFTLGGIRELPAELDPIVICNEIGEFLVSLHEWNWLTSQTAKLSLKKNVPYIELPTHFPDSTLRSEEGGSPDSPIRGIIAIEAADSLVNSMTLTSQKVLMQLQTQQIAQDGPNYYCALQYRRDDDENLMNDTENIGMAPLWSMLNGLTAAANTREDPYTFAKTANTLTDPGVSSGYTKQRINRGWLPTGDYEFSVCLAVGSTDTSQIQLHGQGADGGPTITAISIDWTVTPYAAVPTGAANPDPRSTHDFSVDYLRDGWVQLTIAVTHHGSSGLPSANYLEAFIYPATTTPAETGFIYATRAQVTRRRVIPPATAFPDGPAKYVPQLGQQSLQGAKVANGGPPIPTLAVWPVPSADSVDKFLLSYAAGWPTVRNEDDVVSIPNWLESWFLEATRVWARGINEEDEASLSERLSRELVGQYDRSGRPQNLLLALAMQRDSEFQPHAGHIEGGATSVTGPWKDWGFNTTVAGPV